MIDLLSNVCPQFYLCRNRKGAWFITDAPADVLENNPYIVWFGVYD